MRLQGKGLKRVNSYGTGDHYVHFKIKIPDKLTEKQKALMLAFAETEKYSSDATVEGVVDTNDGECNFVIKYSVSDSGVICVRIRCPI